MPKYETPPKPKCLLHIPFCKKHLIWNDLPCWALSQKLAFGLFYYYEFDVDPLYGALTGTSKKCTFTCFAVNNNVAIKKYNKFISKYKCDVYSLHRHSVKLNYWCNMIKRPQPNNILT
jgi:hypothetical protein